MTGSSAKEQVEGTCFVVGAACVFALVALIVKKDPLPLVIATECRFLVSWVVAIAFMLLYRKSRNLHWFGPPELRKWLLLKCAMSFAFITCWWSAIRRAPVGDCIAVIYCSPILTSLLSRVLLKEALAPLFPLQVMLVGMGCLLVLDPPFLHSGPLFEGGASEAAHPHGDYKLVFLALSLCSIIPIVTRKAKDCSWIEVEHVSACLASTLLDPSLVLAQYIVSGELPPVPSAAPQEMGLIILAAGGAFVGIAMETKGYQMAEPGKAAMFRYVEVPFAYVLQRFCTSEPVQGQAVFGSMLILASCGLGFETSAAGASAETASDEKSKALLSAHGHDAECAAAEEQ